MPTVISMAHKYCSLQRAERQIYRFKIYLECSSSVKILTFGEEVILGLLICSLKICLMSSSDTVAELCKAV